MWLLLSLTVCDWEGLLCFLFFPFFGLVPPLLPSLGVFCVTGGGGCGLDVTDGPVPWSCLSVLPSLTGKRVVEGSVDGLSVPVAAVAVGVGEVVGVVARGAGVGEGLPG